jgi:hypothetical protein
MTKYVKKVIPEAFTAEYASLSSNQLIRYAKYNNWGDRKPKDDDFVIGYLNFKVKCRINGKLEHIHLVVRLRNTGEFHYVLEVNKKTVRFTIHCITNVPNGYIRLRIQRKFTTSFSIRQIFCAFSRKFHLLVCVTDW